MKIREEEKIDYLIHMMQATGCDDDDFSVTYKPETGWVVVWDDEYHCETFEDVVKQLQLCVDELLAAGAYFSPEGRLKHANPRRHQRNEATNPALARNQPREGT